MSIAWGIGTVNGLLDIYIIIWYNTWEDFRTLTTCFWISRHGGAKRAPCRRRKRKKDEGASMKELGIATWTIDPWWKVRNSKCETNPNDQNEAFNVRNSPRFGFWNWDLTLRVCFGFRYSDFGFYHFHWVVRKLFAVVARKRKRHEFCPRTSM